MVVLDVLLGPRLQAKFVSLFARQGKVFDAKAGLLRNRIGPFGLNAIIARIYSETSTVAQWIRDERCSSDAAPGAVTPQSKGVGAYPGLPAWRLICSATRSSASPDVAATTA